jgi:hypothetical protein
MRPLLALTGVLVGTLVPVSSLSARELIADATPLRIVVETGAKDFGTSVRVCNPAIGDRAVTGRFNFRNSQEVAALLVAKGMPVTFDGTQLNIGCDQASAELSGAVSPTGQFPGSPFAPSVSGGPIVPAIDPNYPMGSPLSPAPSMAVPMAAPGPVLPEEISLGHIRYRDPSPVIALLSKLPGLSVIADPKVPGPLLLAGSASIVRVAEQYLAELDTCPVQVQLEAAVVSSSVSSARSRGFGLQFHSGSTSIGSFDQGAGAAISIPSLRIYLSGLAEGSEFRVNSSLKSRVLLGETVKVQDGQDIPIRSATSVTDRETRQDIVYRSVGHQMVIKLAAIEGNNAILVVEHELSSQTANGSLGPVFTTRSVTSTMRVEVGKPTTISLSGSDSASKLRGRGIFSRSDSTEAAKAGAFLVFALERVGCAAGPGSERSEERKPDVQAIPLKEKSSDRKRRS